MIEVVQTPPLNSVQDDGRVGFRGFGIGRSGAMDHVALAAANALLGNEENAAAIELQLYPFAVKFHSDTLFVLTGATARAKLDGVAVLPWWVTPARGGQKLVVSEPVDGLRTYLAIAGGVEVPVILGSRSTQLRDGFGGFEGRSLKAGDQLEVGHAAPVTLRDLGGYGASPALSELPSATWAGSSPGESSSASLRHRSTTCSTNPPKPPFGPHLGRFPRKAAGWAIILRARHCAGRMTWK